MKRVWVLAVCAWLAALSAQARVIYVTPAGGGEMDGSSWSNALDSIQEAIDLVPPAAIGVFNEPWQIWVAGGLYTPDECAGTLKSALCIPLDTSVELYGGFAGVEADLQSRDLAANRAIINAAVADAGAPARHVVQMAGVRPAEGRQVLDGFILTGGCADTGMFDPYGAGNGGGGILLYPAHTQRTVAIRQCIIAGNSARLYGGGILAFLGGDIFNCLIAGNVVGEAETWSGSVANCPWLGGGGVWVGEAARMHIDNCTLAENRHPMRGPALFSYSGMVLPVRNALVCTNQAEVSSEWLAAALSSDHSSLTGGGFSLRHCLFQDNTNGMGDPADLGHEASHSLKQGGEEINAITAGRPGEEFVGNLGGAAGEAAIFHSAGAALEISDAVFDPASGITTFSLSAASLIPNACAGQLAVVDEAVLVVLSNAAGSVDVAGDHAAAAETLRWLDYRAAGESAVIDRGDDNLPEIVFSQNPEGFLFGPQQALNLGASAMLSACATLGVPGGIDLDGAARLGDGDADGAVRHDIGAYEAVGGSAASLAYRWQLNGVDLEDGEKHQGASSPTLMIHDLQPEDEGGYACVASYGDSTAQSEAAEVICIQADTSASMAWRLYQAE